MRGLMLFLFVKLAGIQLSLLDYPLGGHMRQPQVEIQPPVPNLP